jgi:retron-type reverse transcriptase
MPLLSWIQSLFGKPPARDVSRLQPAAPSTPGAPVRPDVTEEAIDTSGGPLKPGHRRRAIRDPRLFPKARAPINLRFGKPAPTIPKAEADRMFGPTLRTRNRQLRDLLTDEEQLKRLGLPVWKTEDDVADALGISLGMLWHFASHRTHERCVHYVAFEVPKRSGGTRVLFAPKRRLKALQRRLHELLVRRLPVSEHAHGFVTGRSIRTGADPHVGRDFVLHLDLQDFFPSVTFARVRGLLIAYGYAYPVAATLAALCTESRRQPVEIEGVVRNVPVGHRHCVQGAPTSPGLCNALVLRLDRRLAGLARKFECTYTRYADDLTFSGDIARGSMIGLRERATEIIVAEGFVVNRQKTFLASRAGRQTVTGVVVNDIAGLSRQDRRRLRAEAHQQAQAEREGKPVSTEARARFEGRLAYLSMLNPGQARALRAFRDRIA